MDAQARRLLRALVEANDGTIVDGDDVALKRDPQDLRLGQLGAQLRELQVALNHANQAAQQFRKISQVLLLLPEQDPRRLDGLTAEIDMDVDTLVQAYERLRPRLKDALDVLGVADTTQPKDTDWI